MSFSLFVLSTLMAADTLPVVGISAEDQDRLTKIIACFEAREVRREPVLIRYQLAEYQSSQMMAAIQKNNRVPQRGRERKLTRNYELALKETKAYLKSWGPFNLSPAAVEKEEPSVWIFDGNGWHQKADDRYSVSSQPGLSQLFRSSGREIHAVFQGID